MKPQCPLVSVICLAFNQESFIREALQSVFNQSYESLEIIVVDDASHDGSAEIIDLIARENQLIFIRNPVNLGNCASFNKALTYANGEFIVDFACDDVMMHDKIEKQVKAFEHLDLSFGIVYTNLEFIDERSCKINSPDKIKAKNYQTSDGDIYKELLAHYFVSASTLLVRKEVHVFLGGYDESLAYEDFDFFIRASREYKFYFLNENLFKRRLVKGSQADGFFRIKNKMQESTLRVCKKALWLNITEEENNALTKRIRYEAGQAFLAENFDLISDYHRMLKHLKIFNVKDWILGHLTSYALLSAIARFLFPSKFSKQE